MKNEARSAGHPLSSPAALPNLYPGISKPLEGAKLRVILNGIGVQSVAMYLLAERGLIGPKPDYSITSDTGDETSGAMENLAFLRSPNMACTIPIHVVQRASMSEDYAKAIGARAKRIENAPFFIRNDDGSRGILARKCTRHYKIDSNEREIRRLLGLAKGQHAPRIPVVEQWMGITVDEAHRVAPSRHPFIQHRHPLIEIGWSRWDCSNWLEREYGIRAASSGCRRCPYRDDEEWQEMKVRYPDDFEVACQADEAIRHGLPGVKRPAYIHDSLKPLREIDFAAEVERKRGTLFGAHSGMCGSECFS